MGKEYGDAYDCIALLINLTNLIERKYIDAAGDGVDGGLGMIRNNIRLHEY